MRVSSGLAATVGGMALVTLSVMVCLVTYTVGLYGHWIRSVLAEPPLPPPPPPVGIVVGSETRWGRWFAAICITANLGRCTALQRNHCAG